MMQMQPTAGLTIEGLTKHFGAFTAVKDVNLTIREGDVLCLLGPSGCGKTTTLRMIAGLEEASEGVIRIDGSDLTEQRTRDRNIAMAFQFYALYPSLTVGENLATPLEAERRTPDEIAGKLAKIASVMELTNVLDRYPHQLSEGEKQRVAVGRCIIRDATCFLFDEPLSRLDVRLREEMRAEIAKVLKHLSKPVVIVTHDQIEAMTMATHIAVMRDGRIEQYGTPDDLFYHPVNTFVAGFIGTPRMNLVEANLSPDRSGIVLGANTLPLPAAWEINPGLGTSVTLGFRPRSVTLAKGASQQGISGEIEIIEPMGDALLVHVNCGLSSSVLVICDNDPDLKPGVEVTVGLNPEFLHLFDSDGKALTP